jgi:hypothetical protein
MIRHVSKVWDFGESVRDDCGRERFDLGERDRLPSERMPGDGRGFDS